MAMNLIQFQPGMSLPEFGRSFGAEAQCVQALERARWPQGFRCPRCGEPDHCKVEHRGRKVYQCSRCRHQASLTAGTMFCDTKLPLTVWFLAIFLISQAKTGLSSLALKRQLGVSYPTAWLMHHKIMGAMAQQEAGSRLHGKVELDDAYLGGERVGGRAGRGSENKVPFVAAVSLDPRGRPMHLKLATVAGFTREAIARWARGALAPGAVVTSDGLSCFTAVAEAGCTHQPIVVGDRHPRELPEFTWVNTVLGNLKTSLAGAYHAFDFRKYATSYFAAFAYRFNRRFDLRSLVAQLITDVTRAAPMPLRAVRRQADTHC
jgi:transposase-like protein